MRTQPIDDAFFALSHPVRRAILERLALEDQSVADISAPFDVGPSQMTKHLHVLERAGLLSREKQGRVHRLHFEAQAMEPIMDWMTKHKQFWETRLDALGEYLDSLEDADVDET